MKRLVLLITAVVMAVAPIHAQDGAQSRWEQKTPEERELLRRRFDELKAMSPEERKALEVLAHKLKEREVEVRDKLPGELRSRLAELPPPERNGMFREHFKDVLRREGERVRDRLPEDVLHELEQCPPPRRPLRLEKILRDDRPLKAGAVRRLGESMGAGPEELADVEKLDREELEDLALSFHRRRITDVVEELGPPPGLDDAGWAELVAASHQEFFRRWRALDPPEVYGAPSDGKGKGRGHKRRGHGGPGERGPHPEDIDPENEAAREFAPLYGRAMHLLEPTFEERLELAELSHEERKDALSERTRLRFLAFVRENDLLSAEKLSKLEAEHGRDFDRLARRLLRDRKKSIFGERPGEKRERDVRGEPGGERPAGLPKADDGRPDDRRPGGKRFDGWGDSKPDKRPDGGRRDPRRF